MDFKEKCRCGCALLPITEWCGEVGDAAFVEIVGYEVCPFCGEYNTCTLSAQECRIQVEGPVAERSKKDAYYKRQRLDEIYCTLVMVWDKSPHLKRVIAYASLFYAGYKDRAWLFRILPAPLAKEICDLR